MKIKPSKKVTPSSSNGAKIKNKQEKIGIILSGGGMRCAYSAGALIALVKRYKLREPFALAAESGSVGNAMYYLARQYNAGEIVWTKLLVDKKFVSTIPTRMDVDYLIDVVFKKMMPLNTKNIDNTKIKYFFSVTNTKTGKTEFIKNKSPFDYYEVMRAAKAVPVLYAKKVRLGGKKFIDGGVATRISDLARPLLRAGATTLITINCEPRERALSMKLALGLDARLHGKKLRDAMLHDIELPPGVCPVSDTARVICITPSSPLNMRIFSNSKKDLTRAFKMGYTDIINNKELRELLSKK